MNQPTTPPSAEARALQDAYAALNRNDIDGFMAIFDPEVVRVELIDLQKPNAYRGIAAVTEHVKAGRGSWAEGACEPRRFQLVGDKVIVFAHVHVRLKSETAWREGDTVDVFTFRDGKATEFRTYVDLEAARKWAGAADGTANPAGS